VLYIAFFNVFIHLVWCNLCVVLFVLMQGLTIIAFNDGSFDRKTILQLLSLGPTYVVMKFIESEHRSFPYCNMMICVNCPDG